MRTVVSEQVKATTRELIRLRKKIFSPWFPRIAFWKFVKNVLVSVVKYLLLGIQVYGMLIICFASMKAAVTMNRRGISVKMSTRIRTT